MTAVTAAACSTRLMLSLGSSPSPCSRRLIVGLSPCTEPSWLSPPCHGSCVAPV
ncbi:hypothetical protein K438DRAFT_1882109 [Mycena galopus ATCC 62051]|nr:hypothetical protein K438DRAFT_1882109 [Mycena galopus ATCC 62051]